MHAGILFPLFTLAASRPPARGRAAHLEPKLALMSVYYVFTPRGHYTAARSCLALRLSRTRGDGLPHAGARGGTELLRAGLPLLPYSAGGPPTAATCHRRTLLSHHASSNCSCRPPLALGGRAVGQSERREPCRSVARRPRQLSSSSA